MNVEFLVDDLEELAEAEIAPRGALLRGLKELGSRSTHAQPQERPDTEAGVRELMHLYAEAAAYMRLMQFAYATSADEYRRSRQRYYRVEGAMADLQREIVPGLRAKLREVGERHREHDPQQRRRRERERERRRWDLRRCAREHADRQRGEPERRPRHRS